MNEHKKCKGKYMCYLFMHQLIFLIIVAGHAIYDVDFPQKVSTT